MCLARPSACPSHALPPPRQQWKSKHHTPIIHKKDLSRWTGPFFIPTRGLQSIYRQKRRKICDVFHFLFGDSYITQVSKVVNTRHLIQKASKTRAGRRPDFVRRTMRATSKRRLAMAVSETEGITGYGHISSACAGGYCNTAWRAAAWWPGSRMWWLPMGLVRK